jgi:hypothetical protein
MVDDSPKTNQRSRGWLIKGVLRRGDILMIYGPSGVGKSIYMLNIAAALVEGKLVLGLWKCKQCNVGLADYEMPPSEIKLRCITLLGDNKNFVAGSFAGRKIYDPSHINELECAIKDNQLSILVIDPLAAAYESRYENQPLIDRDMKTIRSLARRNNCAIILVHHTGRPQYDINGREKPFLPRGHHSIIDAADVIFRVLEGGSPNVTSFDCIKTKYSNDKGIYVDWGRHFVYDPDSLSVYHPGKEDFVNRLISAQRSLKLSNRKVAPMFDVSDRQIGRWRNGVNYPDEEKLPKYFEVLQQLELDVQARRWDKMVDRLKNKK